MLAGDNEGWGAPSRRLGWVATAAFALALTAQATAPGGAQAQEFAQVEATPKGTVGLGLVGAELGFIVPALAGLHEPWAFAVFPAIGAGGGAVAGWFLLDDPNHSEVAVGALAFGMAMLVPTMVITLSATAYDPERDAKAIESGADGASQGASARAAQADRLRLQRLAQAGPGLVRVAENRLLLGVPGVRVQPAYRPQELQRYGGVQLAEVHVPVFTGVF